MPTGTSQIAVHIQFGACLGVSFVPHETCRSRGRGSVGPSIIWPHVFCVFPYCMGHDYEPHAFFFCLCLGSTKLVPVAPAPAQPQLQSRGGTVRCMARDVNWSQSVQFGAWVVMSIVCTQRIINWPQATLLYIF